MISRSLALLALSGLTMVWGQVAPTTALPDSQQASDADEATASAEPLPSLYQAPAPPVDLDDSQKAMMELDDKVVIKVGDQLEYTVLEDREAPVVLLVDEDGSVDFPLVGELPASGMTSRQLALKVSEALKKDYYYQATVLLGEHQANDRRGVVLVMGEVVREGMVEIPAGDILRVSEAIMRAGGFNIYSDPTRVSLIRPNLQNPEESQRFDVNVGQILETGNLGMDIIVRANDRIFVGRRGDSSGSYTLSGAVARPGVYPISIGQKITLSEAILSAGGFTQFGDGSDVKLIRHGEDGSRNEQEINVDEILDKGKLDNDVLLKPGDRIIVDEKWIVF
ncbi:SLBB domain-containing protein [Cerasicoccus maritimus]|uniref:SLBB domain-containing protein n=1 Tax=Cerasicoccus maritimus TaxID=490089 RepID=UPI0028527E80|nr:SLBB domain-containing protein [Cerasicoccus maritimus]